MGFRQVGRVKCVGKMACSLSHACTPYRPHTWHTCSRSTKPIQEKGQPMVKDRSSADPKEKTPQRLKKVYKEERKSLVWIDARREHLVYHILYTHRHFFIPSHTHSTTTTNYDRTRPPIVSWKKEKKTRTPGSGWKTEPGGGGINKEGRRRARERERGQVQA